MALLEAKKLNTAEAAAAARAEREAAVEAEAAANQLPGSGEAGAAAENGVKEDEKEEKATPVNDDVSHTSEFFSKITFSLLLT